VIVCGFLLIIYFNDYNASLVASANLDARCPNEIELHYVVEDYEKPPKQRQGFMHCYCLNAYQANGTIEGVLEPLLAENPDLTENPCVEWQWVYENSFYLTIITGALVSAISAVAVMVFEILAPMEKCISYPEEEQNVMRRIGMI
jgi:hypothetical protein